VSTPQSVNRNERSESFDIEALSASFGTLTQSGSADDLYESFTSPQSSNQGTKTASRIGGLESVLENFDPFTDETPTPTSTSPSKPKNDVKREDPLSDTPDPDEIDELPKTKNTKGGKSAVEAFIDGEKAKEKAQEAKRQVSGTLEAKLNAWEFKDGTQKNIRTLLTTLDTLLWEGSGWKKTWFN